jgi:pimeloyl-ACP methyl ester carboxylesterase
LTIRFAESEDRDDHALLLSPWPESLLAFEPMWARLAEHTHLVAIDQPGFGHSQRRDALLSPRAMGEFVIRVADTFGLENPHAIGPDIGTGASLFAAALQPGRFRSLVVGSGGTVYPLQLRWVLKDWVEAPDLEGYRSAAAPASETRWCHRSTPSSSISGCPTASSTSSTPGTLPGRTPRTSTRHSSRAGGAEATRPPDLRRHRRPRDPAIRTAVHG